MVQLQLSRVGSIKSTYIGFSRSSQLKIPQNLLYISLLKWSKLEKIQYLSSD